MKGKSSAFVYLLCKKSHAFSTNKAHCGDGVRGRGARPYQRDSLPLNQPRLKEQCLVFSPLIDDILKVLIAARRLPVDSLQVRFDRVRGS